MPCGSLFAAPHYTIAIYIFSTLSHGESVKSVEKTFKYIAGFYLGLIRIGLEITVPYLLSGVSKVFLLTRLDRCGLCRGCE